MSQHRRNKKYDNFRVLISLKNTEILGMCFCLDLWYDCFRLNTAAAANSLRHLEF